MNPNCLIVTPEIQELAKEAKWSEKTTVTAIEVWQGINNTTNLPTVDELRDFRGSLQNKVTTYVGDITSSNTKRGILVIPGSDNGFTKDAYDNMRERGFDRESNPNIQDEGGLSRDTYNLPVINSKKAQGGRSVILDLSNPTGVWNEAIKGTSIRSIENSQLSEDEINNAKKKYPNLSEESQKALAIAEKAEDIFLLQDAQQNVEYFNELINMGKPLYVYDVNTEKWLKYDKDSNSFKEAEESLKIGKKSALLADNIAISNMEMLSPEEKVNKHSYSGFIDSNTEDENTVFVFGANTEGRHEAGSAAIAASQFGAILGSTGYMGRSYGLRNTDLKTKNANKATDVANNSTLQAAVLNAYRQGIDVFSEDFPVKRSLSPQAIVENIKQLYLTARQNPNKTFKVQNYPLGTVGLSGYYGFEMLNFYKIAAMDENGVISIPSNMVFGEDWFSNPKNRLEADDFEDTVEVREEYKKAASELVDKSATTQATIKEDNEIIGGILNLFKTADENPYNKFYISDFVPEGALYTEEQLIEYFKKAAEQYNGIPKNISIPASWTFKGEFKDINVSSSVKTNVFDQYDNVLKPEDFKKSDSELTAAEKREWKEMIAGDFSRTLTSMYEDKLYTLKQQMNSADAEIRKAAAARYFNIDRQSFLMEITPTAVFDEMREVYEGYIDDEFIDDVLEEYQNNYNITREEAEIMYAERRPQFEKLLNNFNFLCSLATKKIKDNEFIRIEFSTADNENTVTNEEGVEEQKDDVESANEETTKDGWMIKWNKVKAHDTLGKETRRIINSLYLTDSEGYRVENSLGRNVQLDAEYAHMTILNALKDMTSSEELIPMLEKAQRQFNWIEQVLDVIAPFNAVIGKREPTELHAMFYSDMRKNYMNYWATRRKYKGNGKFTYETFPVNHREGASALMDSWREAYDRGDFISRDCIYDKNKGLNKDKSEEASDKLEEFLRSIGYYDNNGDTAQLQRSLREENNLNTLIDFLRRVNVNINKEDLEDLIEGNIEVIPSIFSNLGAIFAYSKNYTRDKRKRDAFNYMSTNFYRLATLLSSTVKDTQEDTIYHRGSSYFAHTNPGYLVTTLMKLRKMDRAARQKFMDENYKKYDFFFKVTNPSTGEGVWRDKFLENIYNGYSNLEESENAHELDHKVVLTYDSQEYSKWSPIQCLQLRFAEFDADPNDNYFWAQVPILSDVESAQFVRMRKRSSEMAIRDLASTVIQELSRIHTVRERKKLFEQGKLTDKDIIKNYDTGRGERFCFFENLNNFVVVTDNNGNQYLLEDTEDFNDDWDAISFKDFIMDLYESNANPMDVETWCRLAVEKSQDIEYRKALKQWESWGAFETNKDGDVFINLGTNANSGLRRLRNFVNDINALLGTKLSCSMADCFEHTRNGIECSKIENGKFVGAGRRTIGARNELYEKLEKAIQESNKIDSTKKSELLNKLNEVFNKQHSVLYNDLYREFFDNQTLATANIIKITTTDLAYYSSMEDFQKRFKEVHAPSSKLDTTAVWKNEKTGEYERVGTDKERCVYLQDESYKTEIYEAIKDLYAREVAKGNMTQIEMDSKLKDWEETNITDGQALRSLYGYRKINIMSGQWTRDMERAYNRIKAGNWDYGDFNIIWQTKKPYYYGPEAVDSGLDGNTIKVPVQHKNSEFLLLAATIAAAQSNSPLRGESKLVALNKFMEDNDIDVVMFTSAVKVGSRGAVNPISRIHKSFQSIENNPNLYYDYLRSQVLNPDGSYKTNVVHELDFDNYGFQSATPEHIIDTIQGMGTQLRKLLIADLNPNAKFIVEGIDHPISRDELIDLYQKAVSVNILDSFVQMDKKFKNPVLVAKMLQEEIRGNDRYPDSLLEMCTWDSEKGKFNLPLEDEVQTARIQQLFNSIIAKNITKQSMKGGSLIQVSCFGVESEELKIHFKKDENGVEDSSLGIDYIDCYMPATSKEFFETIMDGTGRLNVELMPEELRRLIGYRVPTRAKYSMAPLRIKGFLPQANGSAIMLPKEITTLSGSDFDVDKMYVLLPEFKVKNVYNTSKAWDDFYEENQDIADSIQEKLTQYYDNYKATNPDYEGSIGEYWTGILSQNEATNKKYKLVEGTQAAFNEWFKTNKEKYLRGKKLEKIKPNYKDFFANSREQRNNMILDLAQAVLTSEYCTADVLTPGGFQEQSRAARICDILNNIPYSIIEAKETEYGKLLENWDIDKLDELLEEYKTKDDALNPTTYIKYHNQNMVGAGMIGIYAVASSAHAMVQHSKLSIKKDKAFNFMGREVTSLHEIYANGENGRKISEALRNYIAASVDNTKDNTLSATNQNKFTVNVSTLLARLGYTNVEISVLMNQPIIKDMVNMWQKASGTQSIEKVINKVLYKYKEAAALDENTTYNKKSVSNEYFVMQKLKKAISKSQEVHINPLDADFNRRMIAGDSATQNYFKHQAYVGLLFQRMAEVANDLSELSRLTRQDTQNSAAGKWMSDNLLQEYNVNNFRQSHNSGNGCLEGWDSVLPKNLLLNIEEIKENPEEIMEMLEQDSCPYLSAFYNCGILGVRNLTKQYFPTHYSDSVNEALFSKDLEDSLVNLLGTSRISDKTMSNYFEQLSLYKVMGSPIFRRRTAEKRRKERRNIIYNFKEEFETVLRNNPEIKKLQFIQNLEFVRLNPNGEYWRYSPYVLQLKGSHTALKTPLKNLWTDQWEELATMGEEGAALALKIYVHVLFTSGFKYGPRLLSTLCPVSIRKIIPGYSEMYDKRESIKTLTEFNKQFVLNNLDNRDIAPTIPSNSTVVKNLKFINPDTITKDYSGKIHYGDLGMFEVTLAPNSTLADKIFAKSEIRSKGNTQFIFKRFITIKAGEKGKDIHHFALVSTRGNTALYAPIEPLGSKGRAYEYEYGGEANIKGLDPSDPNTSPDIMVSAHDQVAVNNDYHTGIDLTKQEETTEDEESTGPDEFSDPEFSETSDDWTIDETDDSGRPTC